MTDIDPAQVLFKTLDNLSADIRQLHQKIDSTGNVLGTQITELARIGGMEHALLRDRLTRLETKFAISVGLATAVGATAGLMANWFVPFLLHK